MTRLAPPRRKDAGITLLKEAGSRLTGLEQELETSRNPDPEARRFPTWEIARYMLPVGATHLRRTLANHPDLPQGKAQGKGSTRWFSLAEVETLRRHFTRTTDDRRQGRAPIVALAQAARGTGKTVIASHLAMAARLDGWKVLMIDLDPGAALTRRFRPETHDIRETALAMIARHHGEAQQQRNRERVSRGEAMLPLGPEQSQALKQTPGSLIGPTAWPGLGLIPAGLALARADILIPAWRHLLPDWRPWDALPTLLGTSGVLETHDLVILDTGPGLGWLSLAGLTAADLLLMPMHPSAKGCADAAGFLDLLHRSLAAIEEAEAATARALGLPDFAFGWQDMRFVMSRCRGEPEAAAIEAALGPLMAPGRLTMTAMIEEERPGLYAADYRDFGRETYVRAREPFDALWAGLREMLRPAAQPRTRR